MAPLSSPVDQIDFATDQVRLQAVRAMRVQLQFEFELRAPQFQARRWYVHVAAAPSYAAWSAGPRGAQIATQSEARALTEDGAMRLQEAQERSALRRPIRSLRFFANPRGTASESSLLVRTMYEATIHRRALSGRGQRAESSTRGLSDAEHQWYTAPTDALDFAHPGMHGWLRDTGLTRRPDESEVAFAYRALVFMKREMRWVDVREYDPGHRASLVVHASRGDCAKLSITYAAILRASGIATRILGVRRLPSGDPHTMTEFFARGVGWVPVDVLVDKVGEHRYCDDEAGLRSGFGSARADYFVHYVDDGFRLPTFHGEQTIQGLHSVAWYGDGTGSFADLQIDERWTTSELRPKRV